MKRFVYLIALFFVGLMPVYAGGGKLIILMEDSPLNDENYSIHESSSETKYVHTWDFHKKQWSSERAIISTKFTPLGWCHFSGKNGAINYSGQKAHYSQAKELGKVMKEWQKDGLYVTSLCFGQMDGLGRGYWLAIGSKMPYTDQVSKELGFKKIQKWAKPYMEQGYRITEIAPSTMKWYTVLTKGTDIDRQEWVQYNNYDEFVEGVQKHWDEGWLLQIAEVSPSGKYAGVFCTYTDGRNPRQYVTVVSSKDEAKQFINKHYGDGVAITRFGGSYLPGLLCNYDSNAEKANAIFGIIGGALNSTANLASDIQSHKNGGNNGGAVTSEDSENIPSGLSQGEYQGIYDRFARNAESAFNSLTAASVSGSQYTIMKKQLREAQKSMRKTREEAARAGHSIQKSKWETAQVKL